MQAITVTVVSSVQDLHIGRRLGLQFMPDYFRYLGGYLAL